MQLSGNMMVSRPAGVRGGVGSRGPAGVMLGDSQSHGANSHLEEEAAHTGHLSMPGCVHMFSPTVSNLC